MAESNKMKEMPVNKLMVQMGIPIWIISLFTGMSFILLLSDILFHFLPFLHKKVCGCHISWTYADTLHTFSWQIFILTKNEQQKTGFTLACYSFVIIIFPIFTKVKQNLCAL